jgi:DNA-directed RNA polymerase specialized sigma subunit
MDLIKQHRGIARRIAGWYILKARHLADDLNSAAMEGVVTAVDRINRGLVSHDNYYGYICYFIHQFLGKEIRLNDTITPPQRRAHKKCVSLDFPVATIDSSIAIWDTMEQLEVAIDNDSTLRAIVDLRIIGHTDEEIATVVGISLSGVWRFRKQLEEQWRILNV